jgi:hypothetical protein
MPPALARVAWIAPPTAVAGAVTAACGLGWIHVSQVAATPAAVARGKLWLLATSGVVADRPWLPSLLGFVIVGAAALAVARVRVVITAACAGHVVSAVAVYAFLGVIRAFDRTAFESVVDLADYGLSAIIAAWIGVVAASCWRRYRSRGAHALNAVGCVTCAMIGLAFRPDVTVLDSEHIVAFAIGVTVALWAPARRTADGTPTRDGVEAGSTTGVIVPR